MRQLYLNWNLSTKYQLVVAYAGRDFFGYQKQLKSRTVEGEILKILCKICNDVKAIRASGRTDTGVHAEYQVIGFETNKIFDINRTLVALRQLLPPDILVISISPIETSFDARHSAKKREYRYLFKQGMVPLYLQDRIVSIRFKPDTSLFEKFQELIIGEHDFIHFRKVGSNESSSKRLIYDFSITSKTLNFLYEETHFSPDYYELKIVANGFLYRMVRNLTGAIFEVLNGRYTFDEFKQYFYGQNNSFTFMAAPAKGLSLVKVDY